jgi:chromatin segregation and condensation protein Rec8/ScpA/Scc1 (kleisin family)
MTSSPDLSERALRVSVAVFDGPLDLLLNLVKERQLDIATVPLASIADQYLAYVQAMESLDVELAADYLVVAATLVFLKSKALLPPIPLEFAGDPDESAESVEARLRERLIAYSKYRDAGVELKTRALEATAVIRAPNSSSATASTSSNSRPPCRPRSAPPSPKSGPWCANASRSSSRWSTLRASCAAKGARRSLACVRGWIATV